jgi:hypothetical protein
MNEKEFLEDDSPFVNALGTIQDNSLPRINESWIKKDDVRFDEPKPKQSKEEVPYGSMDLGVDPDNNPKVNPGESLVPDEFNTDIPKEDSDHYKPKKKTILRFGDPNFQQPEYVDPRLPKINRKIRKLKVRPEEDL